MSSSGKQLNNKQSYEGEDIEENVGMTAAPREQQIVSQSNLDEEIMDEEVKSGDAAPVLDGPIQDDIGASNENLNQENFVPES